MQTNPSLSLHSKTHVSPFMSPQPLTYRVWDALLEWRDYLYKSEYLKVTKTNYLTAMLKMIEEGVINPKLRLKELNENWLDLAKNRMKDLVDWAPHTKKSRKVALVSFYEFATTQFKGKEEPCGDIPAKEQMEHILSIVEEKAKSKHIDPSELCNTLFNLNSRDALVVSLILFTGLSLDKILDLKKEQITEGELIVPPDRLVIPKPLGRLILEEGANSNMYLFETKEGKRIRRYQIIRTLKKASEKMNLGFEATPKVIQGYAIAYLRKDKRSKLAKALEYWQE